MALTTLQQLAARARRATEVAASLAVTEEACVLPGARERADTAALAARAALIAGIHAAHPEADERTVASIRRVLLGYSPIPGTVVPEHVKETAA